MYVIFLLEFTKFPFFSLLAGLFFITNILLEFCVTICQKQWVRYIAICRVHFAVGVQQSSISLVSKHAKTSDQIGERGGESTQENASFYSLTVFYSAGWKSLLSNLYQTAKECHV